MDPTLVIIASANQSKINGTAQFTILANAALLNTKIQRKCQSAQAMKCQFMYQARNQDFLRSGVVPKVEMFCMKNASIG